jgi:acid phosphatase family membrane protein YuiD
LTALIAWFIAQGFKVILGVLKEKRFNFKWFVGTGGMPSSHAAVVSALATSVGLTVGFASPHFAIVLLFTVVVLFDAQGVRHASGKQAEILNKILDDIYWKKASKEDRLKELLGHTPVEVLAGTVLGILIALYFNN